MDEYWSLEATLEAVEVVCKPKQFAVFTCLHLLHSACSRSSFACAAGRQVMLKQLWSELLLNVFPGQPERNKSFFAVS